MHRIQTGPQLNKDKDCGVLHEQHNDGSEKKVDRHKLKFFFRYYDNIDKSPFCSHEVHQEGNYVRLLQ